MLAMSTFALLALSSEGGGGSLVDINPGLICLDGYHFYTSSFNS